MAVIKSILHKKNSSGSYDELYLRTRADNVLLTDNSTLLSAKLTTMDNTIASKAAGNHTHTVSQITGLSTSSGYEIADIRFTPRGDLDSNWLLANGATISSTDYPELVSILSNIPKYSKFATTTVYTSSSNSSANTLLFVKYVNGYWIVGGTYYTSSTYYAYIDYATSITGPWTRKIIYSGSNATQIQDITYGNGYWVIGGYHVKWKASLFYSTSLSGTWTVISNIWQSGSDGVAQVLSIEYANGYFVAGGYEMGGADDDNGSSYIAYATTPTGTWTKKNIDTSEDDNSGDGTRCHKVYYTGSYWIAINYNSANVYPRLYYSSNNTPTTWTLLGAGKGGAKGIAYANGYYLSGGRDVIYYTTNPKGTWTSVSITQFRYSSGSSVTVNDVTHDGTKWIAALDYGRLIYSYDLTNWTLMDATIGTQNVISIYSHDGVWAAVGSTNSNPYNKLLGYVDPTSAVLPTVTSDVNAYIKAK